MPSLREVQRGFVAATLFGDNGALADLGIVSGALDPAARIAIYRNNALGNYRKALAKDETAVSAANNLAWLYAEYGKGNMDEAVRLAQTAVQSNPGVPSFSDTLGWVYYKKGLYGAAAEQLKKAVTVDEEAARRSNSLPTPTYYFHLGVALAAKGDKSGARKEIETALRLSEKTSFPEANEARKTLATL